MTSLTVTEQCFPPKIGLPDPTTPMVLGGPPLPHELKYEVEGSNPSIKLEGTGGLVAFFRRNVEGFYEALRGVLLVCPSIDVFVLWRDTVADGSKERIECSIFRTFLSVLSSVEANPLLDSFQGANFDV